MRGVRGVRRPRGAAEQRVHRGGRRGSAGGGLLRAVRPAGQDDGLRSRVAAHVTRPPRHRRDHAAGPRRRNAVLARGAGATCRHGAPGPGRREPREQLPQGGQPAAVGHDVDGSGPAAHEQGLPRTRDDGDAVWVAGRCNSAW